MTDFRSAGSGLNRLAEVVASNLRRIRQIRGFSLTSLARDSGVARATLHQLEAAKGNPTIETLFALSFVLGVPFSELVTENEPPPVEVIRAEEGPVVSSGMADARLLRRFPTDGSFLELFELRVRPGKGVTGGQHPSGVFEHVLVHVGHLMTGPKNDPVNLFPGDYIAFRADQPHSYQAVGGEVLATLIMQYPPTMKVGDLDREAQPNHQPQDGKGETVHEIRATD